MKNKTFNIFILMVVLIFSTINLAHAMTPPPKKLIAEGITEPIYERDVPNGKASDEVGAWKANYALHTSWEFWNVGSDGGEQYAEVIATSTLINGINSRITTSCKEIKEVMMCHYEPSSNTPPDLPSTTYKLRFSGGPSGIFTREDGTAVPAKLKVELYGGFTIQDWTPILVSQNPEAFKDWVYTTTPDDTVYETVDETVKGTTDTGMRFDGISGQVEYLLPGPNREDWRSAKYENVGFPPGTRIKTSEDSSAKLSFGTLGVFVLKPESEIVLRGEPVKESKLKILAGNMWVNVKKMVNEGSMEIEMNQAVAGIKGTTFVVSEINGVSSLKVIEGTVEYTAKSDGKKINVTGGSMVSASNAGLSNVESFDAAKETADWNAVMRESTGVEKSNDYTLIYVILGVAVLGVIFIVALICVVIVIKKKTKKK